MTELVSQRRQNGVLGIMMMPLSIIISVMLGSIAVDTAHIVAVKTQLQNATDAGALAGAIQLIYDPSIADNHALSVTGKNRADGKAVSNSTPGVTVVSQTVPPDDTTGGQVTVSASMTISHLLAPIFGRTSDVISTTSVAGRGANLQEVYGYLPGPDANTPGTPQTFPIALDVNAPGDDGVALKDRHVGDVFNIYFNSTTWQNAAWTSFKQDPTNAPYVRDAISQRLGLSPPQANYFPNLAVGENISTNTGMLGQHELGLPGTLRNALIATYPLVLPIVVSPNLAGSGSIAGFIAIRVLDADNNLDSGQVLRLNVKIVPATVLGSSTGGTPSTTPVSTNFLVGPVKMIN
jgi:Flp pilus assembly protein TadG